MDASAVLPFDYLASFSDAVAAVYESRLDPAAAGRAEEAIRQLLDADRIVFCNDIETSAELRKGAGGRVLCLDIVRPGGSISQLLALRGSGRPPFGEESVMLLAKLRPHLEKAERLGCMLPHGPLARLASDTFVGIMNKGVLVTDSAGVIRWQNPAAAAILQSGEGLSCVEGSLRAARAFEMTGLRRLLANAREGERGAMLIGRGAGKHSYGVAVVPLPASGPDHLVLVAIKEMEREIDVLGGRLGELFGLTGAEKRLAVYLLNGHTLQSAADASGKTLATVKTQLHHLLQKTGARGQSELMHVLMSLPSLI